MIWVEDLAGEQHLVNPLFIKSATRPLEIAELDPEPGFDWDALGIDGKHPNGWKRITHYPYGVGEPGKRVIWRRPNPLQTRVFWPDDSFVDVTMALEEFSRRCTHILGGRR